MTWKIFLPLVIISAVSFNLLLPPIGSDGSIYITEREVKMGYWSIVVPEAATNYIVNPSAEATGNFTALGAATVTRSTDYAWRGVYSYKVVSTAAAGDGMTLTLQQLANAAHYVTVWVRGTLPAAWAWSLDGGTDYFTPTLLNTEGSWLQYGCAFSAAEADGSLALRIKQTSTAAVTYYVDAVQCETADHWTIYTDGDEPGGLWSGVRHASYSTRSAQRREGGRVRNLADFYSVNVLNAGGYGVAPQTHQSLNRATMDGATYSTSRTTERPIQMALSIPANSLSVLHTLRKAFYDDIKRDKVWPIQPFLLRYTGAGRTVQIPVIHDSGMEGGELVGFNEIFPIRFIAYDDPYWQELREQGCVTASSASVTLFYIVGRVDGIWTALGVTAMGGTPVVRAIVSDGKGNLYVAGDFTSVNGGATLSRIAKYNVAAGTWSAVGNGAKDGVIYALCLDAAGNLYAGGSFSAVKSNAGASVTNTAKIAKYTPGTDTWSSTVATAPNDTIYALCVDGVGVIYAGGAFTTFDGVAVLYLAEYSSGTWHATESMGTLNGAIYSIVPSSGLVNASIRQFVYVTGAFTTPVARVGLVQLSYGTMTKSVTALGTGLNGTGYALARDPQGNLYAGGAFTTAGGVTVNYIAKWNGTVWSALGSGLDASCLALHWSTALGGLLAGGNLTTAGATTVEDIAFWSGSTWSNLPVDFPGTCTVYSATTDGNGNVFIGFNTTGSTTFAYDLAAVTLNNAGTSIVWPIIEIKRSGGTSATLNSFKNVTTGKEIKFNSYALQDGETVTIDLRLGEKTVKGDFPPGGSDLLNKLDPSSDLATWGLLPGGNQLSLYVLPVGAPTITLNLRWAIKHWAVDGGA